VAELRFGNLLPAVADLDAGALQARGGRRPHHADGCAGSEVASGGVMVNAVAPGIIAVGMGAAALRNS
jgi:hypothetical protein